MLIVLPQRIHKTILFLEDYLGPLLRLGVAEYPTRVILGFDYKYTVSGDYDVIDLG